MRILSAAILLCAVSIFFASPSALAQERILSYASDITVNEDATVLVTETIKVVSAQNKIKHGIYRDFPTTYRDMLGNRFVVAFGVQSVTRDGELEPYRIEGLSNGKRVYIGSAAHFIAEGEHTYVLTYKTDRQIGFFKDYDELYWNVTGSGWEFPIEQASATVTLPGGVPQPKITLDGWTGPQNSKAQNIEARMDASGRPSFRTTSPLGPHEGLTIGVYWPKGFVTPPNPARKASYFLHDNRSVLVCILGLFVTFAYFMWAQMKVGIDPSKGAIVPQWDPPDGLSPAALRYIRRMSSDNRAVSAALINAAVKGAIKISEERKVYTITRAGEPKTPLSAEEEAIVNGLLRGGDSIVLNGTQSVTISAAILKFTKSLQKQFDKGYFSTHVWYGILGTTIAGATIFGAVSLDDDPAAAILTTAALLIIMNIVFYRLLRAFTKKGRALMDKAEGLRLYMRVAEQERLEMLNPPDKTPELFEKLLPYALALGVEHQWSEQFSDVLAKAQAEGYEPSWYVGRGFYAGNYSGFASSVGSSFASAISSSSTPPGSSSSGGGGGRSGGGGGGGGGGGW